MTMNMTIKRSLVAGILLAGLAGDGLGAGAEAAPPAKPLFSGMKNENDSTKQHVLDALTAFSGANKHWPGSLDDLAAFARQYNLPLDLSGFDKANYAVQSEGGAEVAVFEFVMKGSPTKGAFALVTYTVKK